MALNRKQMPPVRLVLRESATWDKLRRGPEDVLHLQGSPGRRSQNQGSTSSHALYLPLDTLVE